MKYIHGISEFTLERDCAVTLGKFDGIHVGHQKLVSIVKEKAKEMGLMSCVFTFDTLPLSICPQKYQHFITTNSERREYFDSLGVDVEVEYPFTEEFLHTDPDSFVIDVLLRQLRARVVVVGTDFHFGKDRAGNAEYLVEAGRRYGFVTIVVEKERFQDREISATYIRDELRQGHMETVNVLLGRPYSISGIVCRGNQLGRKMDIPTMNIYPTVRKLLPPKGVYASATRIDGESYYGVTNIGVKPTVSTENNISVETYLFDYDRESYGSRISVEIIHSIRPEMKFDSADALARQMESDAEFARSMFM